MPKRKRETGKTGARLTQDPSTYPPLRKSARLLERKLHQVSPTPEVKRQRREQKHYGGLPSPSTTGLSRVDHCPIQLSENDTKKSTNGTVFESCWRKTSDTPFGSGTGSKRKRDNEPGWPGEESRKRPRNNLSTQKVQAEEVVPETSVPVIVSSEQPEPPEIEQAEITDPIRHWATEQTWPPNFAQMASSNSINKRSRTSDCSQSERSRSYSRSRKDGQAPEQYTAAYETHILSKGLDMDTQKGKDLISDESKAVCKEFLRIETQTIMPTAVPQDGIDDVLNDCRNENEPMITREVTPLIIPSIRLCRQHGASHLEHIVNQVNAPWFNQCVLEGPRPQPDLAIGLFSSAFTEEEIDKLKRYSSILNWTQVTSKMYFPFLMCEVKCGEVGLNKADRQNMHSCSVAVRALLKIEQEADKYRSDKRLDSLDGKVLAFSISHDQEGARLFGHFATVQGEKWTYYRYPIRKFDFITDLITDIGLLAIHNFVRNVLKSHPPQLVSRLKNALAALPGSTNLLTSSGLSFVASEISLNSDDRQQDSQDRDADGFVVPPRPDSSQNSRVTRKGQESQLLEQIGDLMRQLQEEREENKKESRKREEESRKREEESRKREEESRKREERQRQEHKDEVGKLLQRFLGKPAG